MLGAVTYNSSMPWPTSPSPQGSTPSLTPADTQCHDVIPQEATPQGLDEGRARGRFAQLVARFSLLHHTNQARSRCAPSQTHKAHGFTACPRLTTHGAARSARRITAQVDTGIWDVMAERLRLCGRSLAVMAVALSVARGEALAQNSRDELPIPA